MASAETKLETRLRDLIPVLATMLLPRRFSPSFRWQRTQGNNAVLREIRDPAGTLHVSVQMAEKELEGVAEFKRFRDALNVDPKLKDAERVAGYWGTCGAILAEVVADSARIARGEVRIDSERAVAALFAVRKRFSQTRFDLVGRARLVGIDMTMKEVSLPGNAILHRLTVRERNSIQPREVIGGLTYNQLLNVPVELRVPLQVHLDDRADNALFSVGNEGVQRMHETATLAENALRLALGVPVETKHLSVTGAPIPGGVTGSEIPMGRWFPKARVQASNVETVLACWRLLSDETDETLRRASHRFTLGVQRSDPQDTIVDYAIAFETILLTAVGNAERQELSYRFAMRGAALLAEATQVRDRHALFCKFKAAYRARSTFVHGGLQGDLKKELVKAGFESVQALADWFTETFRAIALHISSTDQTARPYVAKDGWERLILS